MSQEQDTGQSRREFFRTLGRAAAAGGLLAGGAVMALGRTPATSPAAGVQTCARRSRCGGCAVLADCRLPAALSFRRHGERPLP